MNNKWKILDATKFANESPDTFYIPPTKEIMKLRVGDSVKLIFKAIKDNGKFERMWVEISSIKNNIYSGKLVNYPKHINILFGDLVSFTNKNIINIEFSNDDTANNIFHKNCYVTEDVFKKHKVGYIYKEEPDEDMDSGWRMFTGDESDDYLENSKNFKYLPISEILLICDSFIKLLGSEPESYFMKNNETNLWEKI